MEDMKVIEYRFENIDKCIGRIDDRLDEHEKRIQENEIAKKEAFTLIAQQTKNIDKITGVLWFIGSTILLAVIVAVMKLIIIS